MNESDRFDPASAASSELQELRLTCRLLRTELMAVVICLLVFNISVDIFIAIQLRYVYRQVQESNNALTYYQTNNAPRMTRFVEDMRVFSRTNRAYHDQVFRRYPFGVAASTNAAAASAPPTAAP